MSEQTIHLPAESSGTAPGRGRLKGRAILVVGGGQMDIGEPDTPIGNGRAIGVLCAREGAKVAVADRDAKSAEATVAVIAREGGTAHAIAADVTKETDVERMVAEACAMLGALDGIVLNVGIGAGGPWLEGTTAEMWDRVFAVNLKSHMLTVRAAMPKLSDAASIVFISSAAGLGAGSRMPAYDASKAGIFGLCRHVALEGERRAIRANVVAPGLMDTSIGRLATRGRPGRAATRVPLGRQGTRDGKRPMRRCSCSPTKAHTSQDKFCLLMADWDEEKNSLTQSHRATEKPGIFKRGYSSLCVSVSLCEPISCCCGGRPHCVNINKACPIWETVRSPICSRTAAGGFRIRAL